MLELMGEVTQILTAIERGAAHAAEQLLPLVYDELRKLAAQWLTREKPGQTLQPTAPVHEAYLRLVGDRYFANRNHFFAAAAQAMRRILVESARRKGLVPRVALEGLNAAVEVDDRRLLDSHRGVASRELLETDEAFREPIRRQQQLVNWLRLATDRRGEAQQARIRAVVKAYESGLSIAPIAAATRQSTGRVQQLLGSREAGGGAGSARSDTGRSAGAASGTTNEFSSDVSQARRPGKPNSHASPGHLTGR
jgi:RNA polymerase sigma factor (TIGR02999 family)